MTTEDSEGDLEARERLRVLSAAVPIGIIQTDADGICHYWNARWETLTGRGAADWLTLPWYEAVHPDDRDELVEAWRDARERCREIHVDTRFVQPGEHVRWVRLDYAPVLDDSGQSALGVFAAADITEWRELEAQLLQAQKLEAIGQLAAGVAHEINTPTQYARDNAIFASDGIGRIVQLIALFEEALAAPADQRDAARENIRALREEGEADFYLAEMPQALKEAIEGLERTAEIVKAMKSFAHPGSHEKVPSDLNDAIRTTTLVARAEWKLVADVELDLANSLPLVAVHPGEFNQVILNLLINGVHAIADKQASSGGDSAGKGTITIATRALGESQVSISVRDSGCGIPEEIRQRIFEPFFTTKGVGRGTGQGLAIAHSVIVDKHGGSLLVDSTPGEGTTFEIRLPVE